MNKLTRKEVRIYSSRILQLLRNDIYEMARYYDGENELNMPYDVVTRSMNIRSLVSKLITEHVKSKGYVSDHGKIRIELIFGLRLTNRLYFYECPFIRLITYNNIRYYVDHYVEYFYKYVNPEIKSFYHQLLVSMA